MQGLESLNQFQNFVSSIGGLGRYEDTYMVHAAEGETVVPMEVLDRNPVLKKRLFKSMKALGIDPGRYIVGNDLNSLNPVTGQPEFFLKKIFKRIKKGIADISGYAAPVIGAMYGPAAGALAGAAMGSFKRENPGDPSQWAQMGLRGGLSGIGTNIATGQDLMKMGGGLRGAYGMETFNPLEIGKAMLDRPAGTGVTRTGTGMDALKTKDDKWRFMEKYFPGKAPGPEESLIDSQINIIDNQITGLDMEDVEGLKILQDEKLKLLAQKRNIAKATGSIFGDMSLKQLAGLYGLGTAGLGFLIDKTSDDEDLGERDVMPEGVAYDWDPQLIYASRGGVMDLQDGGFSQGPGTGTSDSIPAMLSDGEFVMTADAVRGAGGGDRREGARRMYEAMDRLEARA
jgi:hypothetical protein